MATTAERTEWEAAVARLEDRLREWLSGEFENLPPDGEADLVFAHGPRRLYVAPNYANDGTLPGEVDLWTNLGTRVRLRGPYPGEGWRTYTQDLVDMRLEWRADRVRLLCRDLLRLS